ncbi:hypothetical protein CO650_28800 [Rhizobium phaseoli]|nr:hypothetical protein CO650_28800 [Rhizobium phaseoli]
MITSIETMLLLPQRFEIQMAHSSSRRDVCWNSGTPPPKSLFGSFRKACRTFSRGRLFYFGDMARRALQLMALLLLAGGSEDVFERCSLHREIRRDIDAVAAGIDFLRIEGGGPVAANLRLAALFADCVADDQPVCHLRSRD